MMALKNTAGSILGMKPLSAFSNAGLNAGAPPTIEVTPGRRVPNPFERQPTPDLSRVNTALDQMRQFSPQQAYATAANPVLAQARAQNRAQAGDIRRLGLGAGLAHQMGLENNMATAGMLGQAATGAQSQWMNALNAIIQGGLGTGALGTQWRGQDEDQSNTLLSIVG